MNFLDNTISEENIEQQLSQLDKWLHAAGDWILAFLPKLITSIIIIGVGFLLAKKAARRKRYPSGRSPRCEACQSINSRRRYCRK